MISCPYCAEKIKKEAILCRNCGKELEINIKNDENRISQQFTSISKRSGTSLFVDNKYSRILKIWLIISSILNSVVFPSILIFLIVLLFFSWGDSDLEGKKLSVNELAETIVFRRQVMIYLVLESAFFLGGWVMGWVLFQKNKFLLSFLYSLLPLTSSLLLAAFFISYSS